MSFVARAYKANPIATKVGGAVATGGTILILRKLFRPADKVRPTFKKVGVTLPSGKKVDIKSYTQKAGFAPEPLATKLFNEMKGVSWTGWAGGHDAREAAWQELYNLADPVLVTSVYNAYNELAQKKGEPHSLTQAMIDETASLGSIKGDLIIKLQTLGLT